ncbi:MAG: Gx transporter family protein [Bacillota bacterium]|nr:Gx transporter family protein [Bacillota bacterium]
MKIKTRKIALIGILISLAIILGFIERTIPVNFIVPGAKLGLANIVTLISLYIMTFKEASLVLVGRIVIISFLFGSLSSLLFSLSGGVLALIIMGGFIKFDKTSIIGVSILGAIAHNVGQLLMAALVINNINIFYYLPLLLVFAIPTGLLVGTTSKLMLVFIRNNIKID